MCKICQADVSASNRVSAPARRVAQPGLAQQRAGVSPVEAGPPRSPSRPLDAAQNALALWNELLRLDRLASLRAPIATNVFPAVCSSSAHMALIIAPAKVTLEDAFLRGTLNAAPVSAVLGVVLKLLRLITDLHERGVAHCSIRPDKVALSKSPCGGTDLLLADAASCRFASEPATQSDVRGEFAPPHWRMGVPSEAVVAWCESWAEEYGRPVTSAATAAGAAPSSSHSSSDWGHGPASSSSCSSSAQWSGMPAGLDDVEARRPDSGRSSCATADSDAHDGSVFGVDGLDGPAPLPGAHASSHLRSWAAGAGRGGPSAALPSDSPLAAVRRVSELPHSALPGMTPQHAARAVIDDVTMGIMCLRLLPARARATPGDGGVMIENLEPSATSGYAPYEYQTQLAAVWRERTRGADPALGRAVEQLPTLLLALSSESSHITARAAVRHLEALLGGHASACITAADRALAKAAPLLLPPPLEALAPGEGPTAIIPPRSRPLIRAGRQHGAPSRGMTLSTDGSLASSRAGRTAVQTPTAADALASSSSSRFATDRSMASLGCMPSPSCSEASFGTMGEAGSVGFAAGAATGSHTSGAPGGFFAAHSGGVVPGPCFSNGRGRQ